MTPQVKHVEEIILVLQVRCYHKEGCVHSLADTSRLIKRRIKLLFVLEAPQWTRPTVQQHERWDVLPDLMRLCSWDGDRSPTMFIFSRFIFLETVIFRMWKLGPVMTSETVIIRVSSSCSSPEGGSSAGGQIHGSCVRSHVGLQTMTAWQSSFNTSMTKQNDTKNTSR